MKGRVEGERDQGNAHLVQDRGQIGPTQKETKREKENELFGMPPFRRQRCFYRHVQSRTEWSR